MNPPPPAARPSPRILASGLGDRILLGALAALIVARPLVHGDDPGRLRLTTPGGSLSFNLCVWLVVLGIVGWRTVALQRLRGEGLIFQIYLGLLVFLFIKRQNVYQRPSEFVGWEFVTLVGVCFATQQLAAKFFAQRGLMNVLLATAVSVAAIGVVQRVGPYVGIPNTEPLITDTRPGLAGDDEFQPQLNAATTATGLVHGTLESPETYLIFLLSALPAAVRLARGTGPRFKVVLPVMLVGGVLAAVVGKMFVYAVPTSTSEAFAIFKNDSVFLGCGGAGFSRAAADGSVASGSAWLTLLATIGLFGCFMAVMLTGVVFAFGVVGGTVILKQTTADEAEPAGTQWEFYLGGIAGLLGGFILAVGQMPAESPVWEVYKVGGFAVGRGIVWLAAYGLLERSRPTSFDVGRGMMWGIIVVFVAGIFSEGAASPVILFTAVVMAGVWSAAQRQETRKSFERPWTRPLAVALTVVTAAVVVYYLISAAAPGWQTADAVRKARMASRLYPDVERQIDLAKSNVERANARSKAVNFLNGQILNPLRSAAVRDPHNAALLLEIARWERPLWRQLLYVDPAEAALVGRDILKRADQAAKLDPKNIAGQQAILEALFLYRKESNSKPAERLEAFNNHLAVVAQRLPHLEVPYRYRMVMTLLQAGDADGVEPEIANLLRLNRVEGQPHGALTDAQRQEVIDKAKAVIQIPPQELLDEWTR